MRFIETHASVSPLSTHGKAFNGAISMLISATVVKTCNIKSSIILKITIKTNNQGLLRALTVGASSGCPLKECVPRVSAATSTGVVAHRTTQIASRYLRRRRYLSSCNRTAERQKTIRKNPLFYSFIDHCVAITRYSSYKVVFPNMNLYCPYSF